MTLLNKLMETCAILTQKVAHLEHDKVAQAVEITKIKQRVRKLERKGSSNHYGLKRLRKVGRIEEDVNAVKEVNAAEPTVFADKETTMTMAQTLIKMKAEKQRILDEQMAKRLQDEEVKQASVREIQEKEDLEKAKVLQQQYDQRKENINWNNMAGYKIQHFKGMTNDQVRPIFEREYNKVQTFLKSDRHKEPTRKTPAKETLLQESFKRLRVEVEVSSYHSTQQDTPTVDPTEISKEDVQNMLQIVP
uniref:Reverse transcriptase domain-containing protein n=1 Tax=Tanacetum cinerariifolium TaxID=118510 RepID=A0A699K217_TANCI|nr:hypothetical protein [Tanacetum cinerariifolium]